MRALIPLTLLLTACANPHEPQLAINPFPQGDLSDESLVIDFQSLATDSRFLSYQLIRVQRGDIENGQVYDIPFTAPAERDLILVSACGSGCTSPVLALYDFEGKSVSSPTYGGNRAYIGLNVGTSPKQFRLDLSLTSCPRQTCSAYWALYAK